MFSMTLSWFSLADVTTGHYLYMPRHTSHRLPLPRCLYLLSFTAYVPPLPLFTPSMSVQRFCPFVVTYGDSENLDPVPLTTEHYKIIKGLILPSQIVQVSRFLSRYPNAFYSVVSSPFSDWVPFSHDFHHCGGAQQCVRSQRNGPFKWITLKTFKIVLICQPALTNRHHQRSAR